MAVITDKNKISALLDRRVDENGFFPLRNEVEDRLDKGEELSFYYGIDPTGKDIHLGHTVQLLLLKGLSDLGHRIILLMGDFTARIGDPTGKDKARKPLTEKEIKENMETYLEQVYKIMPKGSFEVKYNSEWLKNMGMDKLLELTSQLTVQQMIARDMFQDRIKKEKPIGIHEFLYPLMQGYDSVAMEIDGEVGGHDQIFNMLVGRDLEKRYLGKNKIVLATKLLVDGSTGKKMSKSEGEIIAINDEPSEIRRKVLATDDKMTKTLFELCTEQKQDWIENKHKELSPREYKELLADVLIRIYHGESKIKDAHEPKIGLASGNLAGTIKVFGFSASITTAKELITSGAVKVNDRAVTDWTYKPQKGDKIKVGKGKFGEIK